MAEDLLVRLHRVSRAMAPLLGLFRPIARKVFRFALDRRYGEMSLMRAAQNGRTWHLVPEVALRGELAEFETVLWLRKVVKPGMHVIDVGANVGQMTMEAAILVGPSGRVLAVEPGSGNLGLLHRHIEANRLDSIVDVVEGACADTEGTMTLFVAGSDQNAVGSGHTLSGERGLRAQEVHHISHVTVSSYTIDGLCNSRSIVPSAIKIDVEGGELAVLRGMRETLREARPELRVGFHPFAFEDPVAASGEIRSLLSDAGYTLDAPPEGSLELKEYDAHPPSSSR